MELVLKIYGSLVLVGFFSMVRYLYYFLWLGPERKRERLRRQGIKGPPPSVLDGNISDIKRIEVKVKVKASMEKGGLVSHDYSPMLFPCFEQWRKAYGMDYKFYQFFFSCRNDDCPLSAMTKMRAL